MTWNLFIDDERNPEDVTWAPWHIREKCRNEPWVVCRNYTDAIAEVLNRGFPSFISFDHDLGDNTKTGHDIAKTLVEADIQSGDNPNRSGYKFADNFDFYVHSKNPVGKANIEGLLNSYLKHKNSG